MHKSARRLPLYAARPHVRPISNARATAFDLLSNRLGTSRPEPDIPSLLPSKLPPQRSPKALAQLLDWNVSKMLPAYILPFKIERLDRYFLPEAALKIFSEHEQMTDEHILSIASFGLESADRALLNLVDALVERGLSKSQSHDTPLGYHKDLITRLCTIILSQGNVAGASMLISPVRHNRRRTLLLPDDEAHKVFHTLALQKPGIAIICWIKRATFRFLSSPRLDHAERAAFREEILTTLEGLYDGSIRDAEDTKALAAKELGTAYAHGLVLPKDGNRAQLWWERAVACTWDPKASARAAYQLGLVYLGKQPKAYRAKPLFPPDVEKGIHYFNIAKRVSSAAALYLGEAYYLDRFEQPKARLGNHIKKYGVRPNDAVAAADFFIAARRGYIPARQRFAQMLLLGRAHPPLGDGRDGMLSAPTTSEQPTPEDDDLKDLRHTTGSNVDPLFVPRSRLETLDYALTLVSDDSYDAGEQWKRVTRARRLRRMIEEERNRLLRSTKPS